MQEKLDIDSYYREIGQLIKSFREKQKKSQAQLATFLGFESRISIANIESGKQKVQVHTLAMIAKYLKIEIESILPPIEERLKNPIINPELTKNIKKEGLTESATKSVVKMLIDLPEIKTQ